MKRITPVCALPAKTGQQPLEQPLGADLIENRNYSDPFGL